MASAVNPPVPIPSRAAAERAQRLLERALGPSKVLTDPESCARYGVDESDAEGRIPDAVVLAESPGDVLSALAVARDAGVPITPRAAGTGRTGGATTVAGGIVLSILGMNRIVEIDRRERVAVVEPGVVLADLHAAVEAEGLFYPPDPNSLASCALGGNLAENAGGPRAFKYGVTRDYVLGVEAFLMGGQRIFSGKRTVKGVTGYDVTSLLVGSEGTLAVLGAATLRLLPLPESATTLLGLFDGSASAMRAVGEIVAAGLTPRCLEFLDDSTLDALRAAGSAIPAAARALLIIEVDGDERACETQSERIAGALSDVSALDLMVARDGAQRESLWSARREMSRAVRRLAKKKLSEDVVVPRQRLGELLECTAAQSERSGVRSLSYGHAGDGNLHVNFLWNEDDERPKVEESIERLFRDVVRLGGTLSGEHGIGVMKAPYLSIEQSSELILLQRDVKRAFDPEGLLNPGKIFPPTGHRAC
ncbi:MAG TPA: FAD-linked oxidase C-terminal domain-containing protein [Polyangiaceae bacterium]|jgi:glycolate oxidase|nr:FAD-linked oxidase C-terminal domain-containing protein [Polyangiaceae bacterium]